MTTSTPRHRKRPKPDFQTPNFSKPNYSNSSPKSKSPPISSSSSSLTSLLSQIEPPLHILPSKSDFIKLLLVVAIAAAVAAFCSFLAAALNRPEKPFCDSDVSDSDCFLSDSCEPCPSNGRCYDGRLECSQGFRKYGKLCIEDGDIYETAKKLTEWTKDRMCKEYAHYMCDGTGVIWVTEDNVKNMMEEYGLPQGSPVDDAKYIYTIERAMEDMNGLVDTRTADDGIKAFKCPDVLAESYKTVACHVRQWITNHVLALTAFCALLAGFTLILIRIRRRWYWAKRAEHLYHQVCDILEDNALTSKSESDREPWLIASRLRDHLLTTRERRNPFLWKMVEELVESDSRLDCYPKLVKGESKVVWEWQVEGSLSSSRRKRMGTNYKQQSVEIALDYNELRQMS